MNLWAVLIGIAITGVFFSMKAIIDAIRKPKTPEQIAKELKEFDE